jgi:hypothetical protein
MSGCQQCSILKSYTVTPGVLTWIFAKQILSVYFFHRCSMAEVKVVPLAAPPPPAPSPTHTSILLFVTAYVCIYPIVTSVRRIKGTVTPARDGLKVVWTGRSNSREIPLNIYNIFRCSAMFRFKI